MLTAEENELLFKVDPDTPMGELMRRYWQPVAAVAHLAEHPVVRLRILGEDLVLYRDLQSRLGLLSAWCPHRGMPMAAGIPEEEGLRCGFTGWLFDAAGRCLETPLEPEDSTVRFDVQMKAYPVQDLGGLIWAYLGPEPRPLLPRWDLLVLDNAFRQIGGTALPCNWLQCMESAVDPEDGPFMSLRPSGKGSERENLADDHRTPETIRSSGRLWRPTRVEFERFKYGILKHQLQHDSEEIGERADANGGPPVLFPIMVRVGGGFRNELHMRVPIDDTHTWNIIYQCFIPGDQVKVPKQKLVPYYEIPLKDEQGEFVVDSPENMRMALWCSQGEIADRSKENLGPADNGLVLYRQLLRQQVSIVEDGGDPINVFRDPSENVSIRVPTGEPVGPTVASDASEVGGFAEHIERYSPVIDQVVALYKKVEKAQGNREKAASPTRTQRKKTSR